MEIQIEQLKKCGFKEVFLATNYKSSFIENFFGDGQRYGVKIVVSKEEEPLGTVGPITLIKNHLKEEPFLVMNGDVLTKCDFKSFYKKALRIDSDLTLGLKEHQTLFRFGNIHYEDDYVISIEEKPILKTNILAGIYFMRPSIFNYIPEKTYFGMDDLINKKLEQKSNVGKIHIKEYWLDIGVVEDYGNITKVYKKHFK